MERWERGKHADKPRGTGARTWPFTAFMTAVTIAASIAVLLWSASSIAPTWGDAWWLASAVALHFAFLTWGTGYCLRERVTWRAAAIVLTIPVLSTLALPVVAYVQLTSPGSEGEETFAPGLYVDEPWAATKVWTQWFWMEITHYAPGEEVRIYSADYACDGIDGDEAMRAKIRGTEPWNRIMADPDMWVDETIDIATYETHGDTATVHQPIMLKKSSGGTGGGGYGVGFYMIDFVTAKSDDLWCVQSIQAVTRTG